MTTTRPTENHAIEVVDLRRCYGSGASAFEAVRGVDLQVATGTIHALLGVNGAGKTSTLEVIEGLAPPSAGTVRVLGLDPVADRAAVRRRTGILLQRSGFVGDLTVRETLRMWEATVTSPRPVDESLDLLDLTGRADTRMRNLSGGEHRRVDLACTLMGRPEVVMLDEPTTGLDPESRQRVWQLVRELKDTGSSVLLTTHYLDEAEALADQVSIMREGRIVRAGTPTAIVAEHPAEISFVTPHSGRATSLPSLPGLPEPPGGTTYDGNRTVLHVADLQPALTRLMRWAEDEEVVLDGLVARTATLESVFLAIAGDTDRPHQAGETLPTDRTHESVGATR